MALAVAVKTCQWLVAVCGICRNGNGKANRSNRENSGLG